MNQEDKQFMSQFGVVLGALVVFTIVIFVLARYLMAVNAPDYGPLIASQKEERLQPVGEAQTGKAEQTAAAAGSAGAAAGAAAKGGSAGGQQTYAQVCSTCHDSGTAGAPMISDKGAWKSRVAQGKQTLYQHAINGLGAMPPKGGDASLSDADVQAAVDYIVAQVGGGASAKSSSAKAKGGQASQAGAKTAGAAPAIAATSTPEGASTFDIMCANCHATGALGAPKISDPAAWKARLVKGKQALYSSALSGIGNMPAKGGHPQLSEQQVKAAVDHIIATASKGGGKPSQTTASTKSKPQSAKAKGDQGAAPAAPAKKGAASQKKSGDQAKASGKRGASRQQDTAQTEQSGTASVAAGKKVYQSVCTSCHESGVAGAPMVSDKSAWQPRIGKGKETLYSHAINGFNAMPPKGGNPQLSDGEVKAAVDYILSAVQ